MQLVISDAAGPHALRIENDWRRKIPWTANIERGRPETILVVC